MSTKIKIAKTFDEIQQHNLSKVILENSYLQQFANKMMELSNRLNEIEQLEDEGYIEPDDYDIKEDYLPAIREFIVNIANM
jgi:ATP-dependent helicase/DNAse subunit B